METIEKLANGNLRVRVDYIFSRHGGRKKIIQKDESKEISEKTHDMPVLNTIARAYRWRELLDTGKVKSKDDLAKLLHYDQSYIYPASSGLQIFLRISSGCSSMGKLRPGCH